MAPNKVLIPSFVGWPWQHAAIIFASGNTTQVNDRKDEFDENSNGLEEIKKMNAADRAAFGFKCKDIIDMGRLMWIKERGPAAALVNFVPLSISPENHLLLAKQCCNHN
ncbi:hypothetical protein V2J09_020152 [Rumex salicifolius]